MEHMTIERASSPSRRPAPPAWAVQKRPPDPDCNVNPRPHPAPRAESTPMKRSRPLDKPTLRQFSTALLAAAALAGCTDDPTEKPTVREDSVGLHAFAGCEPLLDYFHEEAITTLEEYAAFGYGDAVDLGGGAPVAAPSDDRESAGGEGDGPAFSNTNVQELGVDEPDVVKTDGRHLYTVRNGWLLIHDAADLTEVSRTALLGYSGSLLVDGDRALVLGEVWGAPAEVFPDADPVRRDNGGKVVLSLFDLSDRAAPVLVQRRYVEGWLVAARLVAGTARVVVQSNPAELLAYDDRFSGIDGGGSSPGEPGRTPTPIDGEGGGDTDEPPPSDEGGSSDSDAPSARIGRSAHAQEADFIAAMRAAIESTTIEDWLPLAFEVRGEARAVAPVVACERVHRPGERAGFGVTSVISLDLGAPDAPRQDPAVVTGAGVVYAGQGGLYVATPNHAGLFRGVGVEDDVAVGGGTEMPPEASDDEDSPGMGSRGMGLVVADDDREATQLHRFDIADATAPARYVASGRVFGTPLNPFSLSEHQGHLRIATTERPLDEGETVNHLFVLGLGADADGDPALVVTGQITDLAPTEQIYAARFQGERGFLVTFRQVDPLFTLDLSDPTRPAVVGELKVPGFSTYLHPLGADHLIGVGQSADEGGRVTGMQLSLFDVSDFARPALAHAHPLGEGWSDALYDHHAFTYWAPEALLMLPINTWSREAEAAHNGLELFRVDVDTGFAASGFIDHGDLAGWQAGIERSVVIGDAVYTISATGMKANGIDDLAERARVLFPEGERDREVPDDRDGGAEPAPAPEPVDPT